MSVGYIKDGKLVTCATKDDMAAEAAAREAADNECNSNVSSLSAALDEHAQATTGIHGASTEANSDTLIMRDTYGRARVREPDNDYDIANKLYVDGAIAGLSSSVDDTIAGLSSSVGDLSEIEEKLDQEVTDRTAADSNLQNQINQLESGGLDYTVGSDGTYYVYTTTGLQAWATACESSASTGCVLMNSLDMANVSWTPVGTSTAYTGCFDGAGKVLYRLTVSVSNANTNAYAGFFGRLGSGAQVNRLTLNRCSISASVTGNLTSDDAYAGGIVGYCASTDVQIRGCIVTTGSSISATRESSIGQTSYAGGISGYSGTAIGCTNSGSVTATTPLSGTGSIAYAYAGGILGLGGDAISCVNNGTVSGASANAQGYCYVGGIAGTANTVIGCTNSGSVTSTDSSTNSTANAWAGGIAGSVTTALRCMNRGAVSSSLTASDGYTYAGGIAGSATTISMCTNTAAITGRNTDTVNGAAYIFTGGIAGTGVMVSYSDNSGAVTATTSSRVDNEYTYAGGIAGRCGATTSCTNSGSVTATCNKTSGSYNGSAYAYAGGILGYFYNSSSSAIAVIGCASYTGSISATAGASNTNSYAGGIVGYMPAGSYNCISGCANASSCSATNVGYMVGYRYSASSSLLQYNTRLAGPTVEAGT